MGEREGEKHQCVVASHTPPTGGLVRNPGMCPDWESNQRPLVAQAGTQSTEQPSQGKLAIFKRTIQWHLVCSQCCTMTISLYF